MVAEMRNGHGRFSRDCADFVEGLAYSGMRKGEANALEWRDLDFTANEIVVRGDAVTGTKGGEGWRRVPMISDARALFERMRSERPGESLDAKVFHVGECQKALDRACQKSRRRSHCSPRCAASVCDALHRERRGYSDVSAAG